MTTQLFRLSELSDVFADACLRDSNGKLLFLSCYGRDTSIQQLLAAFHLPVSQGGLEHFHLVDSAGRHRVSIGDPDRLDKITGRLPKDNLFGNLIHAWTFDPRLQQPDYANRVVWLVDRPADMAGPMLDERIWALYRQMSPVPLLDHWRKPLLARTRAEYVTALDDPLGDIMAYRIHLEDNFLETVSTMVKSGVLALPHQSKLLAA